MQWYILPHGGIFMFVNNRGHLTTFGGWSLVVVTFCSIVTMFNITRLVYNYTRSPMVYTNMIECRTGAANRWITDDSQLLVQSEPTASHRNRDDISIMTEDNQHHPIAGIQWLYNGVVTHQIIDSNPSYRCSRMRIRETDTMTE